MQLCSKAIIVVISRIKLATDTEGLRGAGGAPVFGRHVVGSSLVPCRAALEQMKYCEMLVPRPGCALRTATLTLDIGTVGNVHGHYLDVL
jgi:hypothetical protein